MPVTLKLSKLFYDTFGQEATDELVDALNAVDQSYRSEFRELFEAHFGRLQAEMKQLETRMGAKLDAAKFEMLKWTFLFWVGTIGIVLVVEKL